MRKIISSTFISLDGVMQAPGGPREDPTRGFKHGGWIAPYADDAIGAALTELFSTPFELLLGRKTYDIFAAYWPYMQAEPGDTLTAQITETFNRVTKHVATHSPAPLAWQNSRWLGGDVVSSLQKLKREEGPVLLVQGSSELFQTLLAHDLVDEIRLLIFPIVLGGGKHLFGAGALPAAFKLTQSAVSTTGVLMVRYERAGDVKTGLLGPDTPSAAELERRRNLR
jgi:dihydrofolate reductase